MTFRVALTGPESTGKSTLSQQLAAHYGTSWVPEYARDYLAGHPTPYTLADLENIAHGQICAEERAAAEGHRVVFCDTDLLVIKIWAEHAFGHCPEWISQRIEQQRYDLVLLMGIDVAWEPDPLREHPHLRRHFYNLYQRELTEQPSNFAEIWGSQERRLADACFLVDELLKQVPAR